MIDAIADDLSASGLLVRGGFDFGNEDDAPPGPSGAPAASVLLVGQAGASAWPHFRAWLAPRPGLVENPLDIWSREVIGRTAEMVGARAVSPSDRPFLPFQQWAMRAEGLKQSPLGILMHPEYGLWHAYRGALLFDRPVGMPRRRATAHLCDSCRSKPCLSACPVAAFSDQGLAYGTCIDHVAGPAGEPCREGGCLARNACPSASTYRYPPGMQAFHMSAFARSAD